MVKKEVVSKLPRWPRWPISFRGYLCLNPSTSSNLTTCSEGRTKRDGLEHSLRPLCILFDIPNSALWTLPISLLHTRFYCHPALAIGATCGDEMKISFAKTWGKISSLGKYDYIQVDRGWVRTRALRLVERLRWGACSSPWISRN